MKQISLLLFLVSLFSANFPIETCLSADGKPTIEPVQQVPATSSPKTVTASVDDHTPPITTAVVGEPHFATIRTLYVTPSTNIELSARDDHEGNSGVAATEYRFDNTAEWSPAHGQITLNSLVPGVHTLFYRSYDRAGNYESPKSLIFVMDSKSPVSAMSIGDPQYKNPEGTTYISPQTIVSISAHDDLSGIARIEYRLDGGTWLTYRETFTMPDEGEHLVEFRSIDNAGNLETTHSFRLVTDTTPPITTLSTTGLPPDSSGTLYISKPTSITLSATDMLSGVKSTQYSINSGRWLPYEPFTVDDRTPLSVSYRSIDNVKNQETVKMINVKIDKNPPVSSISVGAPHLSSSKGTITVSDSTFFTITAADSQSGTKLIEYRIDGGEWLIYAPFTIQQPKTHLIEYRSLDNAGNLETTHSLTVTVNTTPPTTTIFVDKKQSDSGENLYSKEDVHVSLNATEHGSGIKATDYRIDGGAWTPYKPFTIATEGNHLVEFRSIDQLANVEPTRFVNIVIDRTPPETQLVIGDPKRIEQGITHITDKTVLALSATDILSGVASSGYRISGTSERYGTEPFTILTDGEYRIHYWSIDKAGNREQAHSMLIKVDVPKPLPIPPATVTRPPEKPSIAENNPSISDQQSSDSNIPESIRLGKKVAKNKDSLLTDDQMNADAVFGTPRTDAPPVPDQDAEHDRFKHYMTIGIVNVVIIATIFILL